MHIHKPSKQNISSSPQFLSSENLMLKNTIIIFSTMSFIACSLCLKTLNTGAYFSLPDVNIGDISSRIISTLHALLAFLFASLYLKKYISFMTWHKLLSFSIGYLIFDLSRHFFLDTIGFNTVLEPCIHHTAVVIVIINYVGKYPKLSALGFLSEFTNLFLSICWYLLKGGYQNTVLFKVLAVLLLLTFALFRVYNFTRICWQLYRRKASIFEIVGFSTIVGINYYWFGRLLHKWFAVM